MTRYLKSLQTGVVLPYSEALAKSADVAPMTEAECVEYEVSMGVAPSTSVAEQPAPVVVESAPVVEDPVFEEVVVEDATPPEVDEVIAALDTELE